MCQEAGRVVLGAVVYNDNLSANLIDLANHLRQQLGEQFFSIAGWNDYRNTGGRPGFG